MEHSSSRAARRVSGCETFTTSVQQVVGKGCCPVRPSCNVTIYNVLKTIARISSLVCTRFDPNETAGSLWFPIPEKFRSPQTNGERVEASSFELIQKRPMSRDLVVGMSASIGRAKDSLGSGMEDGVFRDRCVKDLRRCMEMSKSNDASVL